MNGMISTSLAFATAGGQEVRILELTEESVTLECAEPIDGPASCVIDIIDFSTRKYTTFEFSDSPVTVIEELTFSYVCQIELPPLISGNQAIFVSRVERLNHFLQLREVHGDIAKISSSGFFEEENLPLYPLEQDREFWASYVDQAADWKEKVQNLQTGENSASWRSLLSSAELAFNINDDKIFGKCLETSILEVIQENMDKFELSTAGISHMDFKRVYIGNEFCPNRIPELDKMIALMDRASEEGFKVTVVISYMYDDQRERMIRMFDALSGWCEQNQTQLEVIINDWGELMILREYPLLVPVLGRLLNKRKKDTRTKWWWGFEEFRKELGENALNSDFFREYLAQWGMSRYEYECNQTDVSIPEGRHSLHFPFFQINTATFCHLNAYCKLGKLDYVGACPQYCSELLFQFPKHLNMIGNGNTVFGLDLSLISDAESWAPALKDKVDRLVYSAV
ncbi:hypothetical protein NST04_24550 [Paenibacillus sp. FSL H7-0756]|uniref:hypothetical protein n=1 Tax=Paenibacillus sp. FSL H7-0756 TaxID=2954738 RepID=UPI0030F8F569